MIHVCRGKFMVWTVEVCRALALEWRMLGEWGPPRQRQQSWGGASTITLNTPATTAAAKDEADFTVESLPMYLMPCQVLLLMQHAPAAKLLRIVDASSLASLRASSSSSSSLVEQLKQRRLALFEHSIQEQAREAALKRKQFAREALTDEAMEQEPEQDGAKRQKTTDANGQSEAAIVGVVAESKDEEAVAVAAAAAAAAPPASAAAASLLPSSSSYHLAMAAYPAPADSVLHQHSGHPVAVSLPILYPTSTLPVLVSTKLNQLELRTQLSHQHQRGADQPPIGVGIDNAAEMQRLVFDGICESLGLKLHDAACPSAASSSSSRQCVASMGFVSSPRFVAFLTLYASFRHLWSEGFFLLPGLHFGADLVAYEDLPSRVHSSYLVKLMPPKEERATEGEADEELKEEETAASLTATGAAAAAPAAVSSSSPLGRLSAVLLSNLARMASGINKAVMIVQPRTKPLHNSVSELDPLATVIAASSSTAVAAADPVAPAAAAAAAAVAVTPAAVAPCCDCFTAFRSSILVSQSYRLECSTFHWNLTPTLANAPFDQSHLKRTQLQLQQQQAADDGTEGK